LNARGQTSGQQFARQCFRLSLFRERS